MTDFVLFGCVFVVLLGHCLCLDHWGILTQYSAFSFWSQRDLMYNVTIDQIPMVGVDLSSFSHDDDVSILKKVLYSGVQVLVVDLFYDKDKGWVLKNRGLKLKNFIDTVSSYLNKTNSDVFGNLCVLLLRMSSNDKEKKHILESGSSIDKELKGIENYIYSVEDFQRRNGMSVDSVVWNQGNYSWPSLYEFFFVERKRMVIGSIDPGLVFNSNKIFDSSAMNYMWDNGSVMCPLNVVEAERQRVKKWRFLSSEYQESSILEYIKCGYSPIIANRFRSENIDELIAIITASTSWIWNGKYPGLSSSGTENQDMETYRCGSFKYIAANNSGSWNIADCNKKMPYVCKSNTSEFDWFIPENSKSETSYYLAATSPDCLDNYQFGVPETPIQQYFLEQYIAKKNYSDVEFWIDFNSIMVNNCWVRGGPNMSCPYNLNSGSAFYSMIIPSSVLVVVFIATIIALDLIRVPIQDNRRSWKKVIKYYSKSETEGVPS